LLAISPTRPEFARQQARKFSLTIPILSDRDNALAAEFGLVFTLPEELREVYRSFGIDLERYNGTDSWALPMPACYIIARDGLIHDAAVSVDHTLRPEPEETLKKLDRLCQ
jgi:peroxiredoxin